MPKLTLSEKPKYIPVAQIVSKDKLNSEVLFLDPNIETEDNDSDFDYDSQMVDFNKYLSKTKPREAVKKQNEIAKHFSKKLKPADDELAELMNKIKHDGNKDFKLKNGSFVPIPDVNKDRTIFYIFAPSGSGKTYLSAMIIKQFMKLNPKSDVYVFSKLDEDKVIDDLGSRIKRINVDTLAEDPIDVKEIPEGSMCLFDDTDCLEDRKTNDAILKLENSIYQVGRHTRISVIKTSHLGSDYKKTRVILAEAHYICVYPSSGSFQQISYILKSYLGMGKNDIQKIKNARSRWVCISKHYPQYVLSESECYLLSN